jgi:D-serine deaminase-like pyridoxal phosphate-dependent protein
MSSLPFPIRTECPPGACVCERETLLADPAADIRVLRLTREEEKRLIARIDAISTYAELTRLRERLQENLGVVLEIDPGTPGVTEIRTVRGLTIRLAERPGLCKKTRQTVPAAVRRCLERHPQIVYAILDAQGLFGAP